MIASRYFQGVLAAEIWQVIVRQDDVREKILKCIGKRFPCFHAPQGETHAGLAQLALDQLGIGRRVFQHQDMQFFLCGCLCHNYFGLKIG